MTPVQAQAGQRSRRLPAPAPVPAAAIDRGRGGSRGVGPPALRADVRGLRALRAALLADFCEGEMLLACRIAVLLASGFCPTRPSASWAPGTGSSARRGRGCNELRRCSTRAARRRTRRKTRLIGARAAGSVLVWMAPMDRCGRGIGRLAPSPARPSQRSAAGGARGGEVHSRQRARRTWRRALRWLHGRA